MMAHIIIVCSHCQNTGLVPVKEDREYPQINVPIEVKPCPFCSHGEDFQDMRSEK